MSLTKSELLDLLKDVKDDEKIQFESIVESGRGYVGDYDCEVEVFFNEDDQNWRLRLDGDERSESGVTE